MVEEVKNSVEDAIDITDMFEFGGPSLVMARCVVGIVDTYMKRCPKDSLLNAFYLKPLQKFKGKTVWYFTVPLGHNKLNLLLFIRENTQSFALKVRQ